MTAEAPMEDSMGATAEAPAPEAPMAEAPATEAPATEAPATEAPAADVPAADVVTDETVTAEEVIERPAWQTIALTDALTEESFTLADFAGKTVFVEPFATWCTNCRQQLANVHAAKQQAGEDVVFVALSVEPNVGSEALAAYAADTGYDLVFAAMPPEMLQALAAQFGQTISNPPATPHFVIRPDGSTSELQTGIQGVEAILTQIGAQG
jgi:thiol-disulfide isomerase/thioredoxin